LLLGLTREKQVAKANKLNLGMSSLLQDKARMPIKTLSQVYSVIDSDSSDDDQNGSDQENDNNLQVSDTN